MYIHIYICIQKRRMCICEGEEGGECGVDATAHLCLHKVMYVCMCVCVYECMCVCVYMCMCVCVYVCMCVCVSNKTYTDQ